MDMIKKQNIEGNDKAVSEIEDGRATTGCDVHPPRKESKIFKAKCRNDECDESGRLSRLTRPYLASTEQTPVALPGTP
jgi:hypothetical protein